MNFSQTYLFKIHALHNLLNKAFDQVLRQYAGITLSQFMLLLVASEYTGITQRAAAQLLGISPAAINRQAEIAAQRGLLHLGEGAEQRGHALTLTDKGRQLIDRGVAALEQHAFKIFVDENRQTSLMEHLDLLLNHTKGVLEERSKDEVTPTNMQEKENNL